jgi:hypothetical protein
MSIPFVVLLCVTAALLFVAVWAVSRRPVALPPHETAAAPPRAVSFALPPVPAPLRVPRPYVPPEGSVMVNQLEVGQTIHLQTQTARYALTLVDPSEGIYDAVRIGPKTEGKDGRVRFRMLFTGSQVPLQRFMYGWFVVGGRLCYYKVKPDGSCLGPITSMAIQRVIFSITQKQDS